MSSSPAMFTPELVTLVTTAMLLATTEAQAAATDALVSRFGEDAVASIVSWIGDAAVNMAGPLVQVGQARVVKTIVTAVADAAWNGVEKVNHAFGWSRASLIDSATTTFPTQALARLFGEKEGGVMVTKLIEYCRDRCEDAVDIQVQWDEVVSLPAQAAVAGSLGAMSVVQMGLLDAVDLFASVGEGMLSGGVTTALSVSGSMIAPDAVGSRRSIIGATLHKLVSSSFTASLDVAAPPISHELVSLGLPMLTPEAVDMYNQMRMVTVPVTVAQNWAEQQVANTTAILADFVKVISHTKMLVLRAAESGMPLETLEVDARMLDLSQEWLTAARNKTDLRADKASTRSERSRVTDWVVSLGRLQLAVGAYYLKMTEAAYAAGHVAVQVMREREGGYAALCLAWQGVLNLVRAIAYPLELATLPATQNGGLANAVGVLGVSAVFVFCQAVRYTTMIKRAYWRIQEVRHGSIPAHVAIKDASDKQLVIMQQMQNEADARRFEEQTEREQREEILAIQARNEADARRFEEQYEREQREEILAIQARNEADARRFEEQHEREKQRQQQQLALEAQQVHQERTRSDNDDNLAKRMRAVALKKDE